MEPGESHIIVSIGDDEKGIYVRVSYDCSTRMMKESEALMALRKALLDFEEGTPYVLSKRLRGSEADMRVEGPSWEP